MVDERTRLPESKPRIIRCNTCTRNTALGLVVDAPFGRMDKGFVANGIFLNLELVLNGVHISSSVRTHVLVGGLGIGPIREINGSLAYTLRKSIEIG